MRYDRSLINYTIRLEYSLEKTHSNSNLKNNVSYNGSPAQIVYIINQWNI